MSGLTGSIGSNADLQKAKEMIHEIEHRGLREPEVRAVPDGFIGFTGSNGNNISGLKAPFVIMDGSLVNGSKDKTVSDADYIRLKYLSEGKDVLKHLSGSYACAIIDEDECIIARDHIGARPVIYHDTEQGDLYFASEAKALKCVTDNVKELSPGHYYSSIDGLHEYSQDAVSFPKWHNTDEAIQIVRELVIKAVEQSVASGDIGGVALSGGLDSSIILAIANKLDKNIKAFTSTFADVPGEDLEYAKLMADYLDVEHHIYRITRDDIRDVMPDALWYLESFDEDCITGFIANYYTSKLASEHIDSVLVGEGADELFGGYFRELEDISDPEEQKRIGKKLVDVAYNTALRRLDRGWMANSVEYYTPFLHPSVVAMSNEIPMDLKVHHDERAVEKWILREAFRDMLPPEIADRPKLRFSRGVGVDDQVETVIPANMDENELKRHPKSSNGISLQSPKELHFYNLFKEQFPVGYENLTARWDPFK